MLETRLRPALNAADTPDGLVLPLADSLKNSEMVYYLREFTAPVDNDFNTIHRWQTIIVARDGKLVDFTRSLGPASDYEDVADILIFSLFEDEVDMVMDTADAIRAENQIAAEIKRGTEESTLVEDFLRFKEEQRLWLLNKSTIGATGKMHQRTGFIRRKENKDG